MLANGYHDVARGKVATVVTSLEMTAPPALRPQTAEPRWTFERLARPSLAEYRALYRAVGEDWLWFSRLSMADAELAAILASPEVELWRLEGEDGGLGMLELDFRQAGVCELAFFGLTPPLVGGPAGRWLMNRAITRAWARPIERFWVHTCTLDHPAALAFYRRSGFAPYRRQVEVFDDPRATGLLRRDAAPHVPIL